ncbi:uracil-DNA glycosylase-like protein [Gaertneriomyces semiglobifer]|nr:uracil-DNA glycosylase-like protein [Gaertneriomyces semiglobifer]
MTEETDTLHKEDRDSAFRQSITQFSYTLKKRKSSFSHSTKEIDGTQKDVPINQRLRNTKQRMISRGSPKPGEVVKIKASTSDTLLVETKCNSVTVCTSAVKHIDDGNQPKKVSKSRARKTPVDLTSLPPLKDLLAPNLDVIFCGINPGVMSATRGHHFAGPTNHFWICMSQSGLCGSEEKVTHIDDRRLLTQYAIGFTNVTPRPTPSSADLLRNEHASNLPALHTKIRTYAPKVWCFIGMEVFKVFIGKADFALGLQKEPYRWRDEDGEMRETLLFVIPSTSGRVRAYSRQDRVELFQQLAKVVKETRTRDGASDLDLEVEEKENEGKWKVKQVTLEDLECCLSEERDGRSLEELVKIERRKVKVEDTSG